jgi:tripartite ATP-independent transporter DctM subunit
MELNYLIALLSFVALLLLLTVGIPIAFAMAIIGFLSFWLISGPDAALGMLGIVPFASIAQYTFTVMPMFVLMGELVFHAGFGKDVYWVARQWLGRLPGGLAIATVFGCAIFGAASGSSIAATVTVGKIAAPEMEKFGYNRRLAAGSICAGGPLDAMIPPSIVMVIYGVCTETSIGKLLIAGFLPGFLAAFIMGLQVILRVWRNPSLGMPVRGVSWKDRIVSIKGVWGVASAILGCIVTIYTGVCTPTEAGALGAFTVFIVGLATKRLNPRAIWQSLLGAMKVIGMIFAIVMGAFIFNYQFAVSGLPYAAAAFIDQLRFSPMVILAAIFLLYIVLGCFLDTAAMLFLTLPVIFPITQKLGFDPIWFGILTVQLCEIGMITPPFGLTLFATKSVMPHVSTTDIAIGAFPFLLCHFINLILLTIFPQISLFLPSLMK